VDTQRMMAAVSYTRYPVTLTYDPTACDSERWLAVIGFSAYGAGSTPDAALDAATNREALGPDPVYTIDDDRCYPDQDGPYTEQRPDVDDGRDDPSAYGVLPVRSGRRSR
jgi:hypothetical protein